MDKLFNKHINCELIDQQGQAAQFHGGGTSLMGSARKKKKHSLRYKKTRLAPSTPAVAAAASNARCLGGVSRKSCSIS
jgi:hypothetical protein